MDDPQKDRPGLAYLTARYRQASACSVGLPSAAHGRQARGLVDHQQVIVFEEDVQSSHGIRNGGTGNLPAFSPSPLIQDVYTKGGQPRVLARNARAAWRGPPTAALWRLVGLRCKLLFEVLLGGELDSTGLLNRTLHVVVGQLAT